MCRKLLGSTEGKDLDEGLSKCPTIPEDVESSFGGLIGMWVAKMRNEGATTLGLRALEVQGDKGTSHRLIFCLGVFTHIVLEPPKLAPTSIDHFIYPWYDLNNKRGPKKDGDSRNALAYLMMTNFADKPVPIYLTYSGAFVEQGATLCTSKDLFWTKWLLPLLKKLSKGTEMVATQPYLVESTSPEWTSSTSAAFEFGSNPAQQDPAGAYYNWVLDSSDKSSSTWTWAGAPIASSKTITAKGILVTASETCGFSPKLHC